MLVANTVKDLCVLLYEWITRMPIRKIIAA